MSDSPDLTFFAWADTHFGYQQEFGRRDRCGAIIDQMNRLVGWPYPAPIGGCVEEPALVAHVGDMLDGMTDAHHEIALYSYFLRSLRFPHYETLGNHDLAEAFVQSFIARHGGLSYSFDAGGVHFVSLAGQYDAAETATIAESQLDFLRRDLAANSRRRLVVLLTHSRLDRVTNGSDVLRVLAGQGVILMISAHIHRPGPYALEGISGIDIGHCRAHPIDPEFGRSFSVIRIRDRQIVSAAWRWDLEDWDRRQNWQTGAPGAAQIIRTEF